MTPPDCPACGGKTTVVTSRKISPTVRQSYFACRNHDCGWTGTGTTSIDKTINRGTVNSAEHNKPRLAVAK